MSDYLSRLYEQLGEPLTTAELSDVDLVQSTPLVNFGLDLKEEIVEEIPSVAEVAPHILDQPPKDAWLWDALFKVFPDWRHGRQPTGDCTRWGKQHNLDCTMAVLYLNNKISKPTSQVAGETIYGFAKSNLANNFGRKGAGSTSYAVSKASEVYGWLHRDKYISDSGAVIDLSDETRYSVVWGENPGSGVPSWLHPIAAKTKVVGMVRAENAMHAGKLIQAGYAVDFSGNISWPRTRREDGVGTSWSSGAHMVSFTGVRWGSDGTPAYFWLANIGHGNHVSGPVGPIPVPTIYAQCGGWIGATYANKFFTGIRNHAHTMVTGWPIMQLGGWGLDEWL